MCECVSVLVCRMLGIAYCYSLVVGSVIRDRSRLDSQPIHTPTNNTHLHAPHPSTHTLNLNTHTHCLSPSHTHTLIALLTHTQERIWAIHIIRGISLAVIAGTGRLVGDGWIQAISQTPLSLSSYLSLVHTHTHARTHKLTHSHTRTHTYKHTHTQVLGRCTGELGELGVHR